MNILSIQSHVAYGYVGNKAAVYPLQTMGYNVIPINTVQFSNHTGYGKWKGEIFSSNHIRDLIEGLKDINIKIDAIISGYMGSRSICDIVTEITYEFKKHNPNLLYLCDPVINNKNCYVKNEVLEFFKENLTGDIITPNQYEAEILSGTPINSFNDVKKIANFFFNKNIKIVVITGVKIQNDMFVFVLEKNQSFFIKIKEYKISPNGTGDLLSALFLGYYLNDLNIIEALQKTVYFLDIAMQRTLLNNNNELEIVGIQYKINDNNNLPGFESF